MDVVDVEHRDLPAQLERAALAGDAAKLFELLEARHEQSIRDWARECRTLRERIAELTQERQRTLAEVRHLGPVLQDAAQAYDKALAEADEKRIQAQRIQLRLGGLDSRLEILRQDINELSAELREVVKRGITT
jgi:hypothetical protein